MLEEKPLASEQEDSILPLFIHYIIKTIWFSLGISLIYCITLLPVINQNLYDLPIQPSGNNRSFIITVSMSVILPLFIIAGPIYYLLFETLGQPLRLRLILILKILTSWKFWLLLVLCSTLAYILYSLYVIGTVLLLIYGKHTDTSSIKNFGGILENIQELKIGIFLIWQILFAYLFIALSLIQYQFVIKKSKFKEAIIFAYQCIKFRWLSLILIPSLLIYPAGLVYVWFITTLIPLLNTMAGDSIIVDPKITLIIPYLGMLIIANLFLTAPFTILYSAISDFKQHIATKTKLTCTSDCS
ncbi:hypothetical protein [Thorsellia anophelis]|uniref:Uncharacterized protein n=1 Tax=Thorsellia anophelis DSM 18579 TaxID=1123402 RepID=A0A1I0FAS2_9GAMM|nr:hypothetical protein [Thorsellia anophelis]SET54259.1 hypothetical protein SAMN02583745_02678 [Thorsellia anophelis DSM 18579]